jgi:hypothetical protein
MTAISSPVQSVLALFQGPLANVRFADIDAAGLSKLAGEVEAAAGEVERHEAILADLHQTLLQRQEALVSLAQQALAYARVYADGDEALLEELNRITLARSAKPRKPTAPKAGSSTRGNQDEPRDAGEPAAEALPSITSSDETASSETASNEAGSSETDSNKAGSNKAANGAALEDSEVDAAPAEVATPNKTTPRNAAKGGRKGRGAVAQGAAS